MNIGAGLRELLGLSRPVSADQRLVLRGGALTHPGLVREENEDSVVFADPSDSGAGGRSGSLFLVADGMGGHAAGGTASKIAAETIHSIWFEQRGPVPEVLQTAFMAANQAIWQRSREDPNCAGMGTTCTAIGIRDGLAWLAHVGDSRAYLLRGETLWRLSEDHSLVAQLVRDGAMTEAEAKVSPRRGIILRSMGTKPELDPVIWREGLPLSPGDTLMLCSDGMTDLVDDETIRATLLTHPPIEACEALIGLALQGGGHDNISVAIVNAAAPGRAVKDTREIAMSAPTIAADATVGDEAS